MFEQLAKILAQKVDALSMTITAKDGLMTVVVIPKPATQAGADEDDKSSLSLPLSLKGTPQELDAGLLEALEQYGAARGTLQDQIEATIKVIKAGTEKSTSKVSKALDAAAKRTGATPKSDAKPAAGSAKAGQEDGDDDENESDLVGGAKSAGTASADTNPTGALFD